jgi:sulfatase maturation enzyme AslB (radical SAM superfamily)
MKTYNHITQHDYETVSGPDWPPFSQFQQHNNVPKFVYDEIDSMLRPEDGFVHSSFCVNPFYAWELPAKTQCCLLPRNSDIEKIKNQMLNNIRPEECVKCWHLEDNGLVSDRMVKNVTADFYTNKDLEFLIEDARQGKNKVINYKVDTSNTCNAACVTCTSESSSTWGRLMTKHGKTPSKNWEIDSADLDGTINYSDAKSIIFRGGEPTLSKKNFWVLEQLIAHNNTQCFISFVTNGSFDLTQRQIFLLKQFSSVNFAFSIDGVGPVFEYLRWPLKWDTIVDNISWCRSNGFSVSASYTISNVNLMYHIDTVNWFEENNIPYINNLVYQPEHFGHSVLTDDLRQQIKQKWNSNRFDLLLHDQGNDKLFTKCREELAQQDRWKNININDYLPEFGRFL